LILLIFSETDLHGVITSVSKPFEKISGYSRSELIGSNHNIVRHPSMHSSDFKNLWDTIQSGYSWSGIITNLRKNGSSYTVKATVSPKFIDGVLVGYFSTREDITELIDSKDKINTLWNIHNYIIDSDNYIVITTDGLNLQSINSSFLTTFGFNSLDSFLISHSCICDLFIDYPNVDCLLPLMNGINWIDYINLNPSLVHEAYLYDSEGNLLIFKVSSKPLNDSSFVVVFSDITQLKLKDDIIFEKSKLAAIGELIGMIAHQWKQPLSALSAMISKISFQYKLGTLTDESFYSDVSKHQNLIIHMDDTMSEFLNFFKPISSLEPIHSSDLCLEPLTLIESTLNSNHISFSFTDSFDSIIQTSPIKVKQVIINLIKNSSDELISKNIPNGFININCSKKNSNIIISISDNAGGIPIHSLSDIFLPYFSTKSKNGTGLGLYMSKIIIETQLKGSLSVKNIDNGAVFTITLPFYSL
jgi:PAS domain S-box-containing protein